jgi:hypothetical protein
MRASFAAMSKSALFSIVAVSFGTLAVTACGDAQKPEPSTAANPAGSAAPQASAMTSASSSAASAAPAQLAAADCQKLLDDAQHEVDVEHITTDKGCKKDDDCMAVNAVACDFKCVGTAIPKAEENEWKRGMAAITGGACKKFAAGTCGRHTLVQHASCHDGEKPYCKEGHCQLKK